MKNLIGLLTAIGLSVLFFAFPEQLPANLGELWGTAEFTTPISETGYWILGLGAAAGYTIWWAFGLLTSRPAGFGSFIMLSLLFAGLCMYTGLFRYADAGIILGCGVYALLSELTRPAITEDEEPSAS